MIWNPFRHRKHETRNDDQKMEFAKVISEMLELQLTLLPDSYTIESKAGGPKPKAIGYVYACVNAALRSRGWDMRDMEIGPDYIPCHS